MTFAARRRKGCGRKTCSTDSKKFVGGNSWTSQQRRCSMSSTSDMQRHHTISITRGLEDLPRVIAAVDEFCESIAASEQDAHSLHLAIEEAVSNVLQHGYGGMPRPVSVSLETMLPGRVRAVV